MHNSILRVIRLAVFIALMFLMSLTPLGLVPLGIINLTLYCVPVVAGTLLFGLADGMILGFIFGLISCLSAFGILPNTSALAAQIVSANPLLAILLCFVPRLLIPLNTRGVQKLLGERKFALPAAAATGSLTNTVFYLGLMLLFYIICGLDSATVLAVITGTGLLGGGGEAVLNALVVPPIVLALRHTAKKLGRR